MQPRLHCNLLHLIKLFALSCASPARSRQLRAEILAPVLPNMGFPGGSDSKESVYNARDLGLIPGLRRASGEGNGNPLQYSCPENSWHGQKSLVGYSSRGRKDLDTTEQLTLPRFTLCLIYLYRSSTCFKGKQSGHTHGIYLGSGAPTRSTGTWQTQHLRTEGEEGLAQYPASGSPPEEGRHEGHLCSRAEPALQLQPSG